MMLIYAIIVIMITGMTYLLLKASDKKKLSVLTSVICLSISVIIYFVIGNPDYSDQPYYQLKQQEQSLSKLSADELITLYEKRLGEADTAPARMVLANMLVRLGRLQQAQPHFKAAYDMDKHQTPHIILGYANILIALNNGKISVENYPLIETVLKKYSDNPQALFYQGLFFAQNNQIPQAVDIWRNLLKNAENKPYYPIIAENLNSVIADYAITPMMIGLKPEKTPSDITAENLPQIEAMVQSLADKVKQNPNDIQLKQRLSEVQIKLDMLKKHFAIKN